MCSPYVFAICLTPGLIQLSICTFWCGESEFRIKHREMLRPQQEALESFKKHHHARSAAQTSAKTMFQECLGELSKGRFSGHVREVFGAIGGVIDSIRAVFEGSRSMNRTPKLYTREFDTRELCFFGITRLLSLGTLQEFGLHIMTG